MRILHEFLRLAAESAPPLILGLAFAAGFVWFISKSRLAARLVARAGRSVPVVACWGAVLPGCSLTTLPLAIPLKESGASPGALLAFIVTSALLGPTSIILTFTMLGAEWGVYRLVLPLLAISLLGYVVNLRPLAQWLGFPESDAALVPGATCSSACGREDVLPGYVSLFLRLVRTLLPVYLLGLLAAASLSVFLGPERIERWLGGGLFAYAGALAAGLPLYVCEGGEVALADAFLEIGAGPGPVFTFVQVSVGTCLTTLFMLPKIIGLRLTVLYLVFWLAFGLASGLLFEHLIAWN